MMYIPLEDLETCNSEFKEPQIANIYKAVRGSFSFWGTKGLGEMIQ
jgi:hypothetical protein